ncbi:ABC transporter ATP-binding protein [Pelagibacterium flavum]|mgnify:CR=1 FL=1|uniref:ABC transporter ATP-binding protein n=1 Tax=Pelagibacterium flavum TaxID=2984530 RepID=A0ABY6IQI6_9HYPH|nr:ABC transporter ATP-binding protein [Pelagibacterium sp. YIM 151497]UYQ72861.1 ABC transporter ATP-binding protein [Pelagibacterium sp. YIM 151497]|tara:strand:- start:9147 stop:9998 length:852 start_codon:yes stop_codon:yes gene_type:complete
MISVSGLTFSYKGAPGPALNGVSLTVPEASVYGLLGPSGSGKSTTQKILMGLLVGFGGTATVFGEAPAHSGRSFYERIGVSFELPALYGRLTARENLALFAALFADAPLSPDTVLDMVDLRDAADQRIETFSKGMKMRLNLARALLNDPPLLFLDEPTTGQDPARARTTRHLIARLRDRGKTVFLTTHNMSEAAEICDTVGFLVDGRIALEGRPAELMAQFGKPELVATARRNGALTTEHFAMEGLAGNAAFQDLLQTGDIVSLHTREASLDDIFVAVAGGGK